MESGAGISGSMGGFGIDSAGAGLGEVVLMRGLSIVLDLGVDHSTGWRELQTISFVFQKIDITSNAGWTEAIDSRQVVA
jgi:hypothetical protein